ncbi:MAG: hypothetical protein JNL40_00055 [Cyclobacteriaceae bacterium]|nr:hypothetical protein [Cyclobacteriaceae bacterium]
MEAAAFSNLVTNYSSLTPEELKALQHLAEEYPYSQLLHMLASRGAQDTKASDQQSCLHRAAVYATDRTVLKQVMTSSPKPRLATTRADRPATATPAPVIVESKVADAPPALKKVDSAPTSITPSHPLLEGDALREDIDFQLHRLHKLMHDFDDSYERLKNQNSAEEKSKPLTNPDPAGSDASLIEEIKTSRKKPKLVSPKVAEQGEIIDHFIKVAPTLPRTKPKEPAADLAEESVNYGDGIVSETLVEILLKQGKKDKAIEMLKKLIWKFPQKKAYFAAQIEALKS